MEGGLVYFELILKQVFLIREFAIEAKEALFVSRERLSACLLAFLFR